MTDSRFFDRHGPFTISSLCSTIDARIIGDPDREIVDVAPLDRARAGELTFLGDPRFLDAFGRCRASACIVRRDAVDAAPDGMALIVVADPYAAYARVAAHFYPDEDGSLEAGISPAAHVDPSAVIGEGASIGAGAVIGAGADIGARSRIGANSVIGRSVRLGTDCRISAGVTLSHCIIGHRVLILPGVRIGQRGFGFATEGGTHVSIPQLGRVLVEDDVEIGANTTIDRGAGSDTIIGRGSRIDNLVQIGHNVEIGSGCVLVAQVGVSGSTRLGDYCVAGGQAGLAGHLSIGSGSRIAAQSGVMRDLDEGAEVCGSPAIPVRQFFRQVAAVAGLTKRKGR